MVDAGDLQDVQVHVGEQGEDGEEEQAVQNDDGDVVGDSEESTETVVGFSCLQLGHHH